MAVCLRGSGGQWRFYTKLEQISVFFQPPSQSVACRDRTNTMTAPRLHCPMPLNYGAEIALPANAARHVQVLRLQPGDKVALFHGGLPDIADLAPAPAGSAPSPSPAHWQPQDTGWVQATITQMGRSSVHVRIGEAHAPVPAQAPAAHIHIACGMPANERMDWLVEKATELGVASIQPLQTERSVLRLRDERAYKKQAHWQAVAIAACEQSGRTAVPWVRPVCSLAEFLQQHAADEASRATEVTAASRRLVLSLQAGSLPLHSYNVRANTLGSAASSVKAEQTRGQAGQTQPPALWLLSGPEGGLSAAEEASALTQGWQPVSLGHYTLRAETAPLAALVLLGQTD